MDLARQEGVTDGKKGMDDECAHTHTHTQTAMVHSSMFAVPRSAQHTARGTHMYDVSFVNAHAGRTHAGCHASTHAA